MAFLPATDGSKRVCFIAMPFGRNPAERRHFDGWYKEVILPAVTDCDYEPFLASRSSAPDSIDTEIRKHLATDAMAVIDLAGMVPADPPNPNVMYELGIRHAFNLPAVIMAWEGQQLPFDVATQRTILVTRDVAGGAEARSRLADFIREAEKGRFFRPMQSIASRGIPVDQDETTTGLNEQLRGLRALREEERRAEEQRIQRFLDPWSSAPLAPSTRSRAQVSCVFSEEASVRIAALEKHDPAGMKSALEALDAAMREGLGTGDAGVLEFGGYGFFLVPLPHRLRTMPTNYRREWWEVLRVLKAPMETAGLPHLESPNRRPMDEPDAAFAHDMHSSFEKDLLWWMLHDRRRCTRVTGGLAPEHIEVDNFALYEPDDRNVALDYLQALRALIAKMLAESASIGDGYARYRLTESGIFAAEKLRESKYQPAKQNWPRPDIYL